MNTDPGRVSQNGVIQKVPGGINRDDSDFEAIRWNGSEHHGWHYGRFYQSSPMFFTAEGHNLWLGDLYRGRSLFVVSSGPSTKDLDLSPLVAPGFITMGLNNSPRRFRPNLWACVDSPSSFLRSTWLDPQIQKFAPICAADKPIFDNDSIVDHDAEGKVILGPDGKAVLHDDKAKYLARPNGEPLRVRDCPNVVHYRRNEHFRAKQFLWEDTINWGNHSDLGGARSIFLVVLRLGYLLGFRRIFLLGVDFNMSAENRYAFPQERSPSSIRGNNSSYETIMKRCEELRPIFDKEGYEVYNLNPKSALKAFEFMDFAKAQELTKEEFHCGGTPIYVEHENTEGLYDRDDRIKKGAELKLEQDLKAKGTQNAEQIKAAGEKALAKLKEKGKPAQPAERREYSLEERLEVKARLDAARELLNRRKEAAKGWLAQEPKDGNDTALKQWVEDLKKLQGEEEEVRHLLRTIEDEKRWKHGEEIRWGLWNPEDERAPV